MCLSVTVASASETAMSKSEKSLSSLTLHSSAAMGYSLRMESYFYRLTAGCLVGKPPNLSGLPFPHQKIGDDI